VQASTERRLLIRALASFAQLERVGFDNPEAFFFGHTTSLPYWPLRMAVPAIYQSREFTAARG